MWPAGSGRGFDCSTAATEAALAAVSESTASRRLATRTTSVMATREGSDVLTMFGEFSLGAACDTGVEVREHPVGVRLPDPRVQLVDDDAIRKRGRRE